jgi:hypothetical protein
MSNFPLCSGRVIFSICFLVLFTGSTTAAAGPVRVAVCSPGYRPFVYDANGTAKGHDIMMVNQLYRRASSIAKGDAAMQQWFPRLGHNQSLEVVEIPFNDMMEGLNSGRYDIALCGIYQTPERAADIDFLPAYLNSGLRLLVRWSLFSPCLFNFVTPPLALSFENQIRHLIFLFPSSIPFLPFLPFLPSFIPSLLLPFRNMCPSFVEEGKTISQQQQVKKPAPRLTPTSTHHIPH